VALHLSLSPDLRLLLLGQIHSCRIPDGRTGPRTCTSAGWANWTRQHGYLS